MEGGSTSMIRKQELKLPWFPGWGVSRISNMKE